jgi:hypothetical protein
MTKQRMEGISMSNTIRVRIRMLSAAVALALGGHAYAGEPLRFEAQGGICEQTRDSMGVWWNGHYPTQIDVTDACLQVGVSQTPWKLGNYRLGWRAAYVNLGRVEFDNTFAMRDDEQFNNPTGADCDPLDGMKGCVGRGIAGGATYGVTLGAVGERDFGKLTLGAEAGAFYYYSEFNVTVYNVPQNGDAPFGGPYSLQFAGWALTPYAGLQARYGIFTLSSRVYAKVVAHEPGCGGCSGITNGPAWSVMGGVSIPLK